MANRIKTPSRKELVIIRLMAFVGVLSIFNFLYFFFQSENRGDQWLFAMLAVTMIYGALRKLYMWFNYINISVPEAVETDEKLKVDILTTYFPGEPRQMIVTTLEAINEITYPHTTYLCDEADDAYLKKFCKENGIIHVTRDNRKDAKAGNINNALRTKATGDICVILDPDHIPQPDFLDPILPHFSNPDIGFVQIVQSYYNTSETLVAQGAAEQTYQFYGPMMMTLNSYGSVNAIGANCVFRRKALDSIGGHAPGLCEDMHTAMLLYSKGWKAVYVPQVLAKGLAPSNLTNFFKQQLKWSRGTFDLLIKVYPKIFKQLTPKQRLHYGVLPLHYFSGVICLLNFLIPIFSLFLLTTPWKGNIIDFGFAVLPVAASSVLIRTYVQKWVIEKKERGFHLLGGLLHINTWWVHLIGLFYTIIDKKVPYLPTPKEDEFDTNLKIIAPNAIVALVSISAVLYALMHDLTPFSIIMSGFAMFNAGIMLFGIYMAGRHTNQNRLLRSNLNQNTLYNIKNIKILLLRFANILFHYTRRAAPILLVFVILVSSFFVAKSNLDSWTLLKSSEYIKTSGKYLGVFFPKDESGLSDMGEIGFIEANNKVDFDIISFYLAWDDESLAEFPHKLMNSIYDNNAIPLITWEPWPSELELTDTIPELQKNEKVLKHIAEGTFDDYIIEFVTILKFYKKPVYLRFAHEFDNPQYPWSQVGNNTPEEFIRAWKHVDQIIKDQNAFNIISVWNPWKPETMQDYYPGDEYVDWIGVTLLNYAELNQDGTSHSFNELYKPFHDDFYWFTRKPVILAEFGSLNLNGDQNNWLDDAIKSIKHYKEISAIVMFNSGLDKNIPRNNFYKEQYLDWSIDSITRSYTDFQNRRDSKKPEIDSIIEYYDRNPITDHDIEGIKYKNGENWDKSFYALTKRNLNRDFNILKETGLNTVWFKGGNIYDSNLLSTSKEFDLNVIYEFDLNTSLSFIEDEDELNELREEILSKVEKLKESKRIIGYSFRYDLEEHYTKPLLFSQQIAYINWLSRLVLELKNIDPEKSVVLETKLNSQTAAQLDKFSNKNLPFDSYGLIVDDAKSLDEALNLAENMPLSVFISDLPPSLLIEKQSTLANTDIVLHNFQDEWENDRITFDGLINFRGDMKRSLNELTGIWGEKKLISNYTPDVIIPAVPLIPGYVLTYDAMIYESEKWITPNYEDYSIDWYLIKNDQFGNSLGIKELGSGKSIELKIPENYKSYELLLIVRKRSEEFITSVRSKLFLPAWN
ncbi:glycosyltransferase [Christiangramia salexigens]|uniref:GH26 domain-containing protein n=1 Tax=Christiangramia salexigens TaxID=1913577 RepID=A0A1L3J7T3_9FLAO|nr:glycosyltransferase family 2 protein [Christiangramia salexigens]APG61196.1 hypothetical protein LPB144_12625 [Christiangramia salexigens]